MSEQENTRLVQQAYERISAGNIPSLLPLLAADVQWRLPQMTNVPFAGSWEGREGVAAFFRTLAETQEILEFEPQQYVAKDDAVVVLGHFRMRIKAEGIQFASDWAHVWTVRSGEVVRFYEYVDTAAVSAAYTQALRDPPPE